MLFLSSGHVADRGVGAALKAASKFTLAAGLALSLAACASSEEARRLAEEPGYPQGFGDGCTTAQEEDKSFSKRRSRDEYLFENDKAYRAGWRQGYLECTSQERQDNFGGVVLGNEDAF